MPDEDAKPARGITTAGSVADQNDRPGGERLNRSIEAARFANESLRARLAERRQGNGPAPGKQELPRVVIVDDDYDVLYSVTELLSRSYQVHAFDSATAGADAVADDTAAVVLDIRMPVRDGFWAFERIRKKNPRVPIIFYSAYQDVKDPFEVMNDYRPFGFILKGGPPRLLLTCVDNAVHYWQNVARHARTVPRKK